MRERATELGWRIQTEDDAVIHQVEERVFYIVKIPQLPTFLFFWIYYRKIMRVVEVARV
jgi:hypothetical protein